MKKLRKKISYMTKVFLVLGLLFNNLSSLSVVFAYEAESGDPEVANINNQTTDSDFEASIDDEDNITISYTGELNDTDVLNVLVSERYTYTHCVDSEETPCQIDANSTYSVDEDSRALLIGTGMVIAYPSLILPSTKLDGEYELEVSLVNITNENEVLGNEIIATKTVSSSSGMELKLFAPGGDEIIPTDGKYLISSDYATVTVAGKMLPGGIGPYDVFAFSGDDGTYTGDEVFGKTVGSLLGFSNRLYGEYTLPVEVTYTRNDVEETYTEDLSIQYGTYEKNAEALNAHIDTSKVAFKSSSANGNMYLYIGNNDLTINELYQALNETYANKNITFVISNVDYSEENGGIVAAYDAESEQTLEEFLSSIDVDSSTKITITDGTLTITYEAVALGDMTGDNNLDYADLINLIDQIVGNEELDKSKANIHDTDDEVNVLDVMHLDQIIKTGSWSDTIEFQEIELDASLELANPDVTITSGDEFEVNYIITAENYDINGIAGNIEYDKDKLELISIEPKDSFIGNNNDGKFIYVGTTYKNYDEVLLVTAANTDEETIFMTVKFKALASGTATITINDPEYFDQNIYYQIVEIDDETGETVPTTAVITLDVEIAESADNSLSSLKVGDNTITLTDGIYNYKLTVANDVKTVNVEAVTSNVAASITSIVSPEELAEGENTITVTVVAENGEEQTYTVIVTREKAPVQNTDTTNYQDDTTPTDTIEPDATTPDDSKEIEPEKKESNVSKIVIIILVIAAILGLIYLIFKDDNSESKTANKDIGKMKKENFEPKEKEKTNQNNKYNQNKNNKKGR